MKSVFPHYFPHFLLMGAISHFYKASEVVEYFKDLRLSRFLCISLLLFEQNPKLERIIIFILFYLSCLLLTP